MSSSEPEAEKGHPKSTRVTGAELSSFQFSHFAFGVFEGRGLVSCLSLFYAIRFVSDGNESAPPSAQRTGEGSLKRFGKGLHLGASFGWRLMDKW